MEEHEIYPAIGEQGFERLVAAFYRQVPTDDVLGPMYPKDEFEAAEQRLRDFLIYRFGGPQRYIEQRGHPRLRMRHAPFPIGVRARDRWLLLMDRAIETSAIPPDAASALREFFTHMATFLINRPDA